MANLFFQYEEIMILFCLLVLSCFALMRSWCVGSWMFSTAGSKSIE